MDTAKDLRGYVLARRRHLLHTAGQLGGTWRAARDLVRTALTRAWRQWSRLAASEATDAYLCRPKSNKLLVSKTDAATAMGCSVAVVQGETSKALDGPRRDPDLASPELPGSSR
ncbi:hypothetical protein [Jidongwangia harbinensis]|uniref:hypothetical protein n=1 Tax=Jidongwangia harbinensis TaxID=2878561 RepID=UPI001CD9D0D4|nr:hypothetical protein [Jidongwangia harbinensis]MCA2219050.1 hypothetical protein [Jidongwangia harbinensis]